MYRGTPIPPLPKDSGPLGENTMDHEAAALLARITGKVTNWPASTDECWRWGGAMSGSSPHIRLPESGQNGGVRALLLRLLNIPHGRSRSPRCRHTWCVNPWHIDPLYNSRARHGRGGQKSPIRFARERGVGRWEGHPLSGRNVMFIKKKNGHLTRRCRLCAYRNLERNGHTTMPGAIARLEAEFGLRKEQ